jgi:hypothetical protein
MELKLDETQAAELRDTLSSALGALRMEIVATDNPAYRRDLKARETVLRDLLGQLGAE